MTRQIKAIIFDFDSVPVDTERDGHRIVFKRVLIEKYRR
jgi:beta-phosphoglucomutase-like phosphatase (HAD superfamily)